MTRSAWLIVGLRELGPGLARNIGIKKAEQWGRGDALYLCDNDSYFLPEWDKKLLEAWEVVEWEFGTKQGFMALGGILSSLPATW